MNDREKHGPAGLDDSDPVFLPDVTVAALVQRDGRLLVVEEDVHGEQVINQPAGHLEPDESLADAMVRECLEETGWRVRPVALVGVYQWVAPESGRQFLRVAFAAEPIAHDPRAPLDEGILRALWMTPDELAACAPRHRSPLVAQVVHDFLAGRRLPLAAVRWLA